MHRYQLNLSKHATAVVDDERGTVPSSGELGNHTQDPSPPSRRNWNSKAPTNAEHVSPVKPGTAREECARPQLKHLLSTLFRAAGEQDRVDFRNRDLSPRGKRGKNVGKASETDARRVSTTNQALR